MCNDIIKGKENVELINEKIIRYINFINITGLNKNPFEDNLRIIESYIGLTRY